MQISEVTSALESWAPRGMQQSYDNAGLQVGDPKATVTRALIALDLTPAVVEEAIATKAELIITHHPLIFRPLKSITASDWHGSLILSLARANVALYCIHTNLDAAREGVSFALAQQLGLKDIQFLRPLKDTQLKLVTFVPHEHMDTVREALAQAGAGRIGAYDACAFASEGTGYFKPGENADPHIGSAEGGLTTAQELRLEVEVLKWDLSAVLKALHEAHPYDEVAYDVYTLHQAGTQAGIGAIGSLKRALTLRGFLNRASDALSTNGLRFVGDPDTSIKRVAVCGGSGSDLIGDAMRAGADAYLTADISYHRFFEALGTDGHPRMALIDAIHYETEACTEQLLESWLAEKFPKIEWIKTQYHTSPIRTFIQK
ncbi:MAG: Nif3-like dinuclear metal center hexameric protein [Pseudomonadota bacterium]